MLLWHSLLYLDDRGTYPFYLYFHGTVGTTNWRAFVWVIENWI